MEAIVIGTTQCMLTGSKLPMSEQEVSSGWSRELGDLIDDTAW